MSGGRGRPAPSKVSEQPRRSPHRVSRPGVSHWPVPCQLLKCRVARAIVAGGLLPRVCHSAGRELLRACCSVGTRLPRACHSAEKMGSLCLA
ncbi:hypothetical protein HAX54_004359 [Datura stramonium]|uniref:Uncharacterized protein n=1 Tax=Datura stramonium TaxID=4076 RepID=A0ABS8T866_DATST|nr:hypothetical protein [Datura stramonium]